MHNRKINTIEPREIILLDYVNEMLVIWLNG